MQERAWSAVLSRRLLHPGECRPGSLTHRRPRGPSGRLSYASRKKSWTSGARSDPTSEPGRRTVQYCSRGTAPWAPTAEEPRP
jgi:hypothetical protein